MTANSPALETPLTTAGRGSVQPAEAAVNGDKVRTGLHRLPLSANGLPGMLMDRVRFATFAFDAGGALVYSNAFARRWTRRYFETEPLPGMGSGELFPGAQCGEFTECIDLASRGHAQEFNCAFLVGRQEERRFQIRFMPLEADDSVTVGVLMEVVQVATRMLLGKSLIDQDELFRYLVQNSSDVMALLEEDGMIRYLSPSAESMLGFSNQLVVGKNARDLVHPDDLKMLAEGFDPEILGPGMQISFSYRVQHADGSWIHLESVATNLLHHPAIKGYVVNTRDVTERKDAEAVLAMEKEWLSVTLRSIGDGVITTDISGNISMMNQTAEQLTGYPQGKAVGRRFDEIYHVIDAQTSDRIELPLDRLIHSVNKEEGALPHEEECVLVAQDGSERLVAHSGALIRNLSGDIIGMVIVFRDITDKQKLADEMNKASRLESVGMLAGGIAHDFNNILLAIVNNVSLARLKLSDNEELQDRLKEAENATMRARDLTRQLLTFSKGGAPVLNTHQLPGIIRESVEFVLHGSKVELRFGIEDGLRPVEIDPGQISQVLNNLAINAVQAMPDGGRLEVSAVNREIGAGEVGGLQPGGYVRIDVSDTGVGIPRNIRQKLFDPFFTTKPTGSGLGLATSYSIIRSHRGAITVDSEVGLGTTFSVYLPASEKETEVESADRGDRELSSGGGRVLLMDDERDIRDTIPLLMEEHGYEVDTAADGRELLEKYRASMDSGVRYDVVVLDLTIPGGMGGREAVGELRKLDAGAVAIVSSGYSNDSTMAEFRKHGFDGVVSKPYRVDELVRAIQELVPPRHDGVSGG